MKRALRTAEDGCPNSDCTYQVPHQSLCMAFEDGRIRYFDGGYRA